MTTPSAPATTDKPKVEAPASTEGDKVENTSSLPVSARPPGDLRRRGKKEKRKGPFVKYVGAAALRRITPAQWNSLAIDLKKVGDGDDARVVESTWSVANDKILEASKFSDDQLDYLLIDDLQQGTNVHAFLLVDYNENDELIQVTYE